MRRDRQTFSDICPGVGNSQVAVRLLRQSGVPVGNFLDSPQGRGVAAVNVQHLPIVFIGAVIGRRCQIVSVQGPLRFLGEIADRFLLTGRKIVPQREELRIVRGHHPSFFNGLFRLREIIAG